MSDGLFMLRMFSWKWRCKFFMLNVFDLSPFLRTWLKDLCILVFCLTYFIAILPYILAFWRKTGFFYLIPLVLFLKYLLFLVTHCVNFLYPNTLVHATNLFLRYLVTHPIIFILFFPPVFLTEILEVSYNLIYCRTSTYRSSVVPYLSRFLGDRNRVLNDIVAHLN